MQSPQGGWPNSRNGDQKTLTLPLRKCEWFFPKQLSLPRPCQHWTQHKQPPPHRSHHDHQYHHSRDRRRPRPNHWIRSQQCRWLNHCHHPHRRQIRGFRFRNCSWPRRHRHHRTERSIPLCWRNSHYHHSRPIPHLARSPKKHWIQCRQRHRHRHRQPGYLSWMRSKRRRHIPERRQF